MVVADIPIPDTSSNSNQSHHDAGSDDNDDDDNDEASQEFSSDSESNVDSKDPPNVSGALTDETDGKEDSSKGKGLPPLAPAPVLSPKAVAEPVPVEGLKVRSGASGSNDGSSPGSLECTKKISFVFGTPFNLNTNLGGTLSTYVYFGIYFKFNSSYMFCLDPKTCQGNSSSRSCLQTPPPVVDKSDFSGT